MGRYQNSPSFFNTLTLMYNYMVQHGYNMNNTSTDYINGGPAELGNYLAQEMLNYGYNDGSNELLNYESTFYTPVNPPLIVAEPGNPNIIDPNRWQSLTLDSAIDQSGNNVQNTVPFISPEWGNVIPFALNSGMSNIRMREGNAYKVYFDSVQPAYLNLNDSSAWESFYKWNHSLVSIWQSQLDASDGVMWDISPDRLEITHGTLATQVNMQHFTILMVETLQQVTVSIQSLVSLMPLKLFLGVITPEFLLNFGLMVLIQKHHLDTGLKYTIMSRTKPLLKKVGRNWF